MKTEYLVKRRIEKGYTQKTLSEALGVSRSTYAGYETSDHQPDLDTLWKMADLLDTTIDILVMRHVLPSDNKAS